MTLPTPEDMGFAPAWENYIVAQVVQSCLGQIPEHALAMGVEIAGTRVRLRFQLSEATESDRNDINDIVSDLEALLGDHVHVESVQEVRTEREISPADGVRWLYLARVGDLTGASE